MRITTKATNTTLTQAISEYIDKKVGHVEKYIDEKHRDAARADVEVEVTGQSGDGLFRAEVNLHAGDIHLRAETAHADLYAAIDAVKDEITRGLNEKNKKRQHLMRRGGQKIKDIIRGFYPKK